ncbi:MAG: hypothetical protein LW807_06665 [Proteobacteria bacterium]|jgi:hypothetical protein|nr:hypothetical protein [Pseudomonadota bacterium]
MDKVLEFKNFEQVNDFITVDLYTNARFIMKISDTESNIRYSEDTGVILYEYFRKAVLLYLGDTRYNPGSFDIH